MRLQPARSPLPILARPEGRAQPPVARAASPPGCSSFNPRPTRGPGATHAADARLAGDLHVSTLARPEGRAQLGPSTSVATRSTTSFNPRPTRRPGAAADHVAPFLGEEGVSILARPEGRAQLLRQALHEGAGQVSILARPEGRAQLVFWRVRNSRSNCFNPRPTRRPGAAADHVAPFLGEEGVSILARPEGRAQPPGC